MGTSLERRRRDFKPNYSLIYFFVVIVRGTDLALHHITPTWHGVALLPKVPTERVPAYSSSVVPSVSEFLVKQGLSNSILRTRSKLMHWTAFHKVRSFDRKIS